jgi:hypothetical protein
MPVWIPKVDALTPRSHRTLLSMTTWYCSRCRSQAPVLELKWQTQGAFVPLRRAVEWFHRNDQWLRGSTLLEEQEYLVHACLQGQKRSSLTSF